MSYITYMRASRTGLTVKCKMQTGQKNRQIHFRKYAINKRHYGLRDVELARDQVRLN